MEAQELFTAIGNFGFPIVLSWYLLLRMEQQLDKLGDCLHELSSAIVKEQRKNVLLSDCGYGATSYNRHYFKLDKKR